MVAPTDQGRELSAVRFPIDRSKLAELARAFHDPDPVWFDERAAAAAGFDHVPTPATVTVIADHWRELGALSHAIELDLDLERLLHGEAHWEYLEPIRVGDDLTGSTRLSGVATRAGRRGGSMRMFTLETEFRNELDVLVARRQDTLIETAA